MVREVRGSNGKKNKAVIIKMRELDGQVTFFSDMLTFTQTSLFENCVSVASVSTYTYMFVPASECTSVEVRSQLQVSLLRKLIVYF